MAAASDLSPFGWRPRQDLPYFFRLWRKKEAQRAWTRSDGEYAAEASEGPPNRGQGGLSGPLFFRIWRKSRGVEVDHGISGPEMHWHMIVLYEESIGL